MTVKVNFEDVPPARRGGLRKPNAEITEYIEAVKASPGRSARWPRGGKAATLASAVRSHLERRGHSLKEWKIETRTIDGEGAAWLTFVGSNGKSTRPVPKAQKKVTRKKAAKK